MNKKDEQDKKTTISISLHPDLIELVEKHSKEYNIKKSKLINDIIKDYFLKNNENE